MLLAGQLSQGQTAPVPGTNGTKWQIHNATEQKTAGLSQERSRWFVQGKGLVCPGDGSCLSPDIVPPKLLVFIGLPAHIVQCLCEAV